jgi:hypothetical protein
MDHLWASHQDVVQLLSSFRSSLAGSPDGKLTNFKDPAQEISALIYVSFVTFLFNWGCRKCVVEVRITLCLPVKLYIFAHRASRRQPIARKILGPTDNKKVQKFSQSAMEVGPNQPVAGASPDDIPSTLYRRFSTVYFPSLAALLSRRR